MAKLLKLRRGTTTQHSSFAGAEGEVTIDTTKDTAVVHDGSTAGGRPLLREDLNNITSAAIANKLGNDSLATTKLAAGALPTDVTIVDANISGNLTIESADIVDGTIATGDIADDAVTAAKLASDSVVSASIVDGSIVNADVNASAAIAGTKVAPAFGSQNLSTSGTAATGALTVTGNIAVSGTVDGVDVATQNTLFGGLTSSSGVLTNGVTATTQSASDNSTKVATTAYTDSAVAALADSAPAALDTLNELAAALGDDANFSTTVTNSIATKLPLAGGTLTGNLLHGDNIKAQYGTGNDLKIYHDGTNSYLDNVTGAVLIRTNDTEDAIKCLANAAVELYYDDSKKLETASGGVNVTGALVASGNVTAFSDSRLKTNIHTIKQPLDKVQKLRGVTFNWLHTGNESSGVIAQEVQEVFPELVEATTHEGKEVLSVDYGKLVGVLIESVKALKEELDIHKAECAKLHGGE